MVHPFRGRYFLSILLIQLLCLSGCNPTFADRSDNAEDQVALSVVIDTLTPDKEGFISIANESVYYLGLQTIELEITNHSTEELLFGESYRVQILKGGVWSDAPLSFSYNDVGCLITPGATRTFQCHLFAKQCDYVPGQYRILKDFRIVKDFSVDRTPYTLSLEFSLRK